MTEVSKFCYRGSIVRIRIRNFMTYTDTELRPGPNLNMILGPNGTGKSAVVCCIIVGLAGEVNLTGRGGSPADFVKKDTDSGSTEIELFNGRGANYIVQRKISITNRSQFKLDHKSEWKINGKSCLKSEVQALTKKLNIKVDNLCQFLPQDSVTQFVKMNTCELLLNTLKAAGDNQLVEDHQKLIEYTKEVDEKRQALENLEKACKENEVNAKRLESEVHQLRQREELVKLKNICGHKIHYVKYTEAKSTCDKARIERDKLKTDLIAIESNSEPYKRAVNLHKSEQTRLRESLEKSNEEVKKSSTLIQQTLNSIENRKVDCQTEFSKFKGKQDQENQRESSIRLKEQELDSLECKLSEIRDVDCSRQILLIEAETTKAKEARIACTRERSKIDDILRSKVSEMEEIKRDMEQIQAVSDKKTSLLKARFPEAHRVLEWLSKNKQRFRKKIYNPMMCEINVKDPKFNRIVEHAIPRQELAAFVCQTEEDLRTFTRAVRDEIGVRFNVILAPDKTVEQFESETSQSHDLSHLGVKTYLKGLIDAPEPIMRYLCGNNNFHRIPVAESCTEIQLKQLLDRYPKFYVGTAFYVVSKSRYDGQKMTVNDSVREAQNLRYSLDQKRLDSCEERYRKLQELRDEATKQRDELYKKDDRLKSEWQVLVEKHRELKNKHDEKKRLETMIQLNHETISKLKTDKIDIEVERRKLQKSIDNINKQIMRHLEQLVEIYENFAKLKQLQMINLLLTKLADRNYRLACEKLADAQRDTTRLKEDIKRKQKSLETFKAALIDHQKIAEEKIPGFKDGELDRATQRKFNNLEEKTIEELTNKREDLVIRIQRIYNDKSNTILTEFNRQNEELKDRRIRIAELSSSIKKIDLSREEIKSNWLPKLEDVIQVIDKNYREFMRKLSYDGQVKLDFNPEDPNDFSVYGIMILVKYRDNEQLIPLSSTRQSGGERSVATMIYMLALQTKTTAPFRCVDEINQGMDKENERKVFELLVQTADSSASQYFLVSPKLLSNLPYSEKMKIHIVYNGKKLGLAWNDKN